MCVSGDLLRWGDPISSTGVELFKVESLATPFTRRGHRHHSRGKRGAQAVLQRRRVVGVTKPQLVNINSNPFFGTTFSRCYINHDGHNVFATLTQQKYHSPPLPSAVLILRLGDW